MYSARDLYIDDRGVKRLFQSANNVWTLFMQIEVNKWKHGTYDFVDKLS